jgi:hypothetical protein
VKGPTCFLGAVLHGKLAQGQRPPVRVEIHPGNQSLPSYTGSGRLRISPLYGVGHDRTPEITHAKILFIATHQPLQALAIARASLPRTMEECIYIAHGWASIVIIWQSGPDVESVLSAFEPSSYAGEQWETDGNGLVIKSAWQSPTGCELPADLVEGLRSLPEYGGLPSWIRAPFDELVRSFEAAVELAAQYNPAELQTLVRLLPAVREIIEDLLWLHELQAHAPLHLRCFADKNVTIKGTVKDKLIHQRAARIIQFNSALSYTLSQANAGTFPLLKAECLIRRYGLLGIGGAAKGVTNLVRSVERLFESVPVDAVIRDMARHREPLTGYKEGPVYDPTEWKQLDPDPFTAQVVREPLIPKIAFFSGRLGYRADEFTLSAAVHSLVAGAGLHWSLMTLTHEILHGHVRDILSYILQPETLEETPDKAMARFFEEFVRAFQPNAPPERQMSSMRNMLFNYVCQSAVTGSITRRPKLDSTSKTLDLFVRMPDEGEFRELFEEEYRNINEIIVHALDYLYFFRGRSALYAAYLWQSWAPVPAVLRDVRQYTLRTLLALSADHPEKILKEKGLRFEEAAATLQRALDEMTEAGFGRPLFDEVLNELRNPDVLTAYVGSIPLVDLARFTLYSQKIGERIYSDDILADITKDDGVHYLLEPGSIAEHEVHSPVAAVADSVRRSRLRATIDEDIEHETAWLLLVLSSTSVRVEEV